MWGGATAFIGYNTIFSAFVPGIDMAAHLGGLATGFVCGLLLTAVSSAQARDARDLAPLLRRSIVAVVLGAALVGLGQKATEVARTGLLADPKMGPRLESLLTAAPAYNTFYATANPISLEFDRIAKASDKLLDEIDKGNAPAAHVTETLDRLKADTKALGDMIPTIPAQNVELQAIRDHLASANKHQLERLTAIDRFIATGDAKHIDGPGGLVASSEAFLKEIEQTTSLRDAYIKAHQLQVIPNKGAP
jgi:rhomboid protease GluP